MNCFFQGATWVRLWAAFDVSLNEKRACVDIVLNIHVPVLSTLCIKCATFFVMSSFYVLISIKCIHLIFVCMFCKQIKWFFSVPNRNLWFFENINDPFVSVYILLCIWYFFRRQKLFSHGCDLMRRNLVDCLCDFWPFHMDKYKGVLLTEKLRSS